MHWAAHFLDSPWAQDRPRTMDSSADPNRRHHGHAPVTGTPLLRRPDVGLPPRYGERGGVGPPFAPPTLAVDGDIRAAVVGSGN